MLIAFILQGKKLSLRGFDLPRWFCQNVEAQELKSKPCSLETCAFSIVPYLDRGEEIFLLRMWD